MSRCFVEGGVIESFDQNIGSAVKRSALAMVTALPFHYTCLVKLSLRLMEEYVL